MVARPVGRRGVERLTPFDLMFLRLEDEAWPCHFGGLVVVDGSALLDPDGGLRMDSLLGWLEARVAAVTRLHQRVRRAGPLLGPPFWADDPAFDVRRHVRTARVEAPGGEPELLAAAAHAYGSLLDRERPLWELWILTGVSSGRVGLLLKLHHCVADGRAAVTVMSALFDPDGGAGSAAPPVRRPARAPRRRDLLVDQVRRLGTGARAALSAVAHPADVAARARRLVRTGRNFVASTAAPASTLNRPVRAGRRLGHLPLDLAEAKAVAGARGGTVNDVVLTLLAGGIRRLLAERGEPTGIDLMAALPVSLRDRDDARVDNRTGTIVLPIPVGEADPAERLALVAGITSRAKQGQRPAAVAGFLARLAGTPWGRSYFTSQRANNVIVTNVVGPGTPVHLDGARVDRVLPIMQLLGNVGLTLAAMSYDGVLGLTVTADAGAFPDLEVLVSGMRDDWRTLVAGSGSRPPVVGQAGLEPATDGL